MNRLLGMLLAVIWVACIALLIQRDVVPFWAAQEPPNPLTPVGQYQVAITNDAGLRIGTNWVTTLRTGQLHRVSGLTQFDAHRLSSPMPIVGNLFLKSELEYLEDGKLEQFLFRLYANGVEARIKGERFVSDFACVVQIGGIEKTLKLDGALSQYLGESLRPFTHLPDLHVGQSWRIRLLDPFSIFQEDALSFTTQIAKVVGREIIVHNGENVDCFRIETNGSVAWADQGGRVLEQEVDVPLLGKFHLNDEPFDNRMYREATSSIPEKNPAT